jgi:hypothetical protein
MPSVVTLTELDALEAAARAACADLDPDAVPAEAVDAVHARLAAVERLVAGARVRLARRVEAVGGWRSAGERSAAHAIARATGCSVARARAEVDTSRRLAGLTATDAAVAAGSLSLEQAAAVTDGAAVNPAFESRLLRCAARRSLGELRGESARAKAAGDVDAASRRARVRASRFLRHRVTDDGAGEIHYRSTVDDATEIMTLLRPHADRVFAAARDQGVRDEFEQYQADALLEMARAASSGEGRPSGRAAAAMLFRVDWPAFALGYAVDGEMCELAGVGPVSMCVVDDMLATGDPFLAAVVTRGEDVVNVAHLGRKARAVQATALAWRDPICAREGCNQTIRLQTDHRIDWARTRHTLLSELDRLCPHDHRLKTVHGWALVAGTGKRPMVPPRRPPPPCASPTTQHRLTAHSVDRRRRWRTARARAAA